MKKHLLIFWMLVISTTPVFSLAHLDSVDLLITNARIVDGTGNPWYKGHLAIDDGLIVSVGEVHTPARRTINAGNQIVAPGFIDVHGHLESSIGQRPEALNFLLDGVTTVITGNCGSSSTDLDQFFAELQDTGIAINIASLIGHNSVRRAVMGASDRKPTSSELDEMKHLVTLGMDAGAVGFSTGLIYVPGTYSETSEVIALAQVAGNYGGIYVSHMRNEGLEIKEAIEEAVNIGRSANMPVEISHFKVSGKPMWNQSNMTIEMIKNYRRQGIDVTVDQYPYTASSTTLAVVLPTWALAGGTDTLQARLADPETKSSIINEMKEELAKGQRDDYTYCAVSNCPWNTSFNGLRIPEVTQQMKGSASLDDQIETILEMVAKGDRVQMVFHGMHEPDVQHIMQAPFTMIASDAGIPQFGYQVPHPRAYGTNARVLGKYVREESLLTLEEAIRKMTSLPANRFNLIDRGLIRAGMAADLVIFDPDQVSDQATFEKPHAYASGFSTIIVNGTIVVDEAQYLSRRTGQILRRGSE